MSITRKHPVIISIIIGIALMAAMDLALNAIGIRTLITYDTPIPIDMYINKGISHEETESMQTDIGIYTAIISIMISFRIYMKLKFNNWTGDLRLNQVVLWKYWMIGLTIYIIITTPLWYTKLSHSIVRIITIIIGGILYFYFEKKARERIITIKNNIEQLQPNNRL